MTNCSRALVVEDDPAIRRLVEKLLQRRGMEIETAHDGQQAIEKIAAGGGYAILVLDLMLPGASGYEIIDYIKRSGVELPVVVVSAVSQQALSKLDLDVVKLVISKPFDVNEFTEGVARICGEAKTTRTQA